jgi:hypothetical protein
MDDRGCWEWFDGRPYPLISIKRKMVQAVRFSLKLAGIEVPDGVFACHTCDNPPCVNPAHIFFGTQSDNLKDCAAKGRLPEQCRPQKACKRGHEFTVRPSGKACVLCDRARGAAYRARLRRAANG